MGVGWGWGSSAYLHSPTCSWLCWAGLYRFPEPRGDPEIGFCPDRGGVWRGPHPSLCSAQIPSSLGALSKPTLLHVPPGAGAGIITAILMVWIPGGDLHTLHVHFPAPHLGSSTPCPGPGLESGGCQVMWEACGWHRGGLTQSHTAVKGQCEDPHSPVPHM